MPVFTQPLNDAELDRLDDFLYRINPGEAMSLEELDGYFCPLICCPEVVPPSGRLWLLASPMSARTSTCRSLP